MLDLRKYVEQTEGKDYMEANPLIIASDIDNEVLQFVIFYNKYHKRKAIKLFLF